MMTETDDVRYAASFTEPNRWENWDEEGLQYIDQGRFREAREYYKTKVSYYQNQADNRGVAASLVRLAGVYNEWQCWDEAARYYRQGINVAQKCFPSTEIHIVLRRYAYCLRKLSERIAQTLSISCGE